MLAKALTLLTKILVSDSQLPPRMIIRALLDAFELKRSPRAKLGVASETARERWSCRTFWVREEPLLLQQSASAGAAAPSSLCLCPVRGFRRVARTPCPAFTLGQRLQCLIRILLARSPGITWPARSTVLLSGSRIAAAFHRNIPSGLRWTHLISKLHNLYRIASVSGYTSVGGLSRACPVSSQFLVLVVERRPDQQHCLLPSSSGLSLRPFCLLASERKLFHSRSKS